MIKNAFSQDFQLTGTNKYSTSEYLVIVEAAGSINAVSPPQCLDLARTLLLCPKRGRGSACWTCRATSWTLCPV